VNNNVSNETCIFAQALPDQFSDDYVSCDCAEYTSTNKDVLGLKESLGDFPSNEVALQDHSPLSLPSVDRFFSRWPTNDTSSSSDDVPNVTDSSSDEDLITFTSAWSIS
jgi:hypothetical protein